MFLSYLILSRYLPDWTAFVDELLERVGGEDRDPVHHPLLHVVILTLPPTTSAQVQKYIANRFCSQIYPPSRFLYLYDR